MWEFGGSPIIDFPRTLHQRTRSSLSGIGRTVVHYLVLLRFVVIQYVDYRGVIKALIEAGMEDLTKLYPTGHSAIGAILVEPRKLEDREKND